MANRWGVIGGGMLGSTCALRLAEAGCEVTLIESQPTLGGLTSQLTHENIRWDRFYHVIEHSDSHLLNLLSELELSEQLNWKKTNTNFYDGTALHPLNNAVDYLRLPALSLIDKLRIGLTIVYGSKIKDETTLENIPLDNWLIKWSGQSGFQNLWLPLLRGKLGDNYKIASAAFIWSVIQRFYGAREGVQKTESFGYVRGGYAEILDSLVRNLDSGNVTVLTSMPTKQVLSADKVLVTTANDTLTFDKVLITTPSNFIAQLCPQLTDQEKRSHNQLRYQGVVCVSLLLRKPLAGAYLTYITDEELPFTTVIEMTSLVDEKEFGGHHLVYLPKYVPAEDSLFDESDEQIIEKFLAGLKQIFPNLSANDIVSKKLSRARQVTTIPTMGYSQAKPTLRTSVANLYICNSAQISNAALSVNESVRLANNTVQALLTDD